MFLIFLLLFNHLTVLICFCFFFQAEDGIRDGRVTGVQTCALPIFTPACRRGATRPAPTTSQRCARSPARALLTRRAALRRPTTDRAAHRWRASVRAARRPNRSGRAAPCLRGNVRASPPLEPARAFAS